MQDPRLDKYRDDVGRVKRTGLTEEIPAVNFEINGLTSNHDLENIRRDCLSDGLHIIEIVNPHNTVNN